MNLPAVTRADWAQRITARWQTSLTAIFETGRLIAAAKASLEEGTFHAMIESDLPFGVRTAQRLMVIAADQRLTDATHVSRLPASWGTLYALTKLDDETLVSKIADGTINPETERSDVARLRKSPIADSRRAVAEGGGTVEHLHELIDEGRTFGVLYIDPPWDYETWSDKGADRSPSQHYDVMTLDELADLPVGELAADNCILHLWTISTLLPAALDLIKAWGFAYKKVGFIWTKTVADGSSAKMGNGKWTRDEAEVCLLATRGSPERLDAGVRQTLAAPLGEHSAKPDEIRARIERLTAGPYLELFARKEVPGWLVWGNQVRWRAPVPPHDPNTGEIIEDRSTAEMPVEGTATTPPAAEHGGDQSPSGAVGLAAPSDVGGDAGHAWNGVAADGSRPEPGGDGATDAGASGPVVEATATAPASVPLTMPDIPDFLRRDHVGSVN